VSLSPSGRRAALVIAAALLVRLAAVAVSARTTVDVLRYHKVADHILNVSLNPYTAPRLYPYPPLWVWFEAGAGWMERQGASFPIVVKLPVVLADVGIVALLLGWSRRAAWVYALHPVSILVTGFHGQFDALMLLFVLAAVRACERRAPDASALALSGAIATKSLPVLLLPFFVLDPALGSPARRLRYVVLAALPVALLLLPYAVADFGALWRELVAYSGIADFGWIGFYRGLLYLGSGRLLRSEPQHWGLLVPIAKLLFLAAFVGLVVLARRVRLSLDRACLAAFLAFLVFYGAVSAQYLLWPLPLGARRTGPGFVLYSIAATVALIGFYGFLAPGVFFDDAVARPTGALWAVGTGATLLAGGYWLFELWTARREP
jgi:hypothetical protein